MAWLALVAQAGGAVMNAQGQKEAATAQAGQFTAAANQDDMTADTIQDAGYQTAQRMRTQGKSTVGQANASLAASGVDLNSSTAGLVREKITQNSESDALNTILNADAKATNMRGQAALELQGAADATKAGQLGVAKTALSAFGGAASTSSNWKTSAGSGSGSSATGAGDSSVSSFG